MTNPAAPLRERAEEPSKSVLGYALAYGSALINCAKDYDPKRDRPAVCALHWLEDNLESILARAATSAEPVANEELVRLREFILDTAAQLTDKLASLAVSHPQHGTHHGRAKQLLDALQKETHLLYASPAPPVAALREEVDQLRSELKSWRGVARNEKAEHERLSAALEAAKQAAAQVEEDDLLVFLDDTFSGGNEIRFVPVSDGPIVERTEESEDVFTVYVDTPRSINEFGDTERPHETLSDALRDWYKRDARSPRAALPTGDATR